MSSGTAACVLLGGMGAPWGRVLRSGNDDRTHLSQVGVV
jgi:hypothetical protein